METKDIAVAVKTIIKARVGSYFQPSPGKVKVARRKVRDAKKKLELAEQNFKKVQDEWTSFKNEAIEKIQENSSALSKINSTIRNLKDTEEAARFRKKAHELARRNRILKMAIGNNRQAKMKWKELKSSVKNSIQNIGQAWSNLMKVTIG